MKSDTPENKLDALHNEIIHCRACPRLVEYREEVARTRRRAYRDQTYWGKPVPGFGDPRAKLLIIGLAPGAHGANRTGRMFTGDRSGDFLYKELHKAGFANQMESNSAKDSLRLCGAYIGAVARCAPPDNKPLPEEIRNCLPFLEKEIDLLLPLAVLALGRIAWENYLRLVQWRGQIARAGAFSFAHGASFALPNGLPRLFGSYHPSQQNTQTGKLTPAMLQSVLQAIREFLAAK